MEVRAAPEQAPEQETRLYGKRWHMLAIFCAQTMVNAVLWISFAPIASLTGDFYGVSTGAVNMASLVFMILYLPGTMFASAYIERHGMRRGIVAAAALNGLSGVMRYGAALLVEGAGGGSGDGGAELGASVGTRRAAFALLILGQSVGAMAQPMFTNAPVRIAGDWFSVSERDVATTIAALCNPLGNALGQVLPTLFVAQAAAPGGAVSGMGTLMLVEGALSLGAALWAWLAFEDQPEKPPSSSAAMRRLLRTPPPGARRLSRTDPSASWLRSLDGLRADAAVLLRDRDFKLLLVGFGVGLGLFNAVLTLIQQLVAPSGYSSDDAGTFGAVLIGVGTVGAGIAGGVLDATHAYRPVLKTGFVSTVFTMGFFLLALRPHNGPTLTAAAGVMGLSMMPLYPITLECAVECTYPISEENSGGLLLLVGNLTGMLFTFVIAALITLQDTYITAVTPAAIFIMAVILLCVCAVLQFAGTYKRLEAEREAKDGADDAVTAAGHSMMGRPLLTGT
jgi:MFS transporter, FLVCR family, MFS-domain-containing protein 7